MKTHSTESRCATGPETLFAGASLHHSARKFTAWGSEALKGTKNEEGAGTYIGKSGTRNLEAECIRRRAESTGGCVELKNEGTNDCCYFFY